MGARLSPITTYSCLAGAIVTETIATIALAASESLSKPIPSIIAVVCFVAAFWLLSFPLRTMPTGIVYAVWSGLVIVMVTAITWVWAKQTLDLPALIGMALITTGVIVINVFPQSATTEEAFAETRRHVTGASGLAGGSQEQTCSAAKSPSTKCR
jgi:small multidrug resistance pump